jgi:hypothetical protein
VLHSEVPADTEPSAFAVLAASWRAMSIGERAELTQQLSLDVDLLARAGIVARHPGYSEVEVCHELARRRYGNALADAAYAGQLLDG